MYTIKYFYLKNMYATVSVNITMRKNRTELSCTTVYPCGFLNFFSGRVYHVIHWINLYVYHCSTANFFFFQQINSNDTIFKTVSSSNLFGYLFSNTDLPNLVNSQNSRKYFHSSLIFQIRIYLDLYQMLKQKQ